MPVIDGCEQVVLAHNARQPLSAIDHRARAEAFDHEGGNHIALRVEMRVLNLLFHHILDR